MTLSYTFTMQSGPAYYSEQTDEEFYDTEDYDWEYDIDEMDVSKYFIEEFSNKKSTKEEQAAKAAEEIIEAEDKKDLLQQYEVETLLEVAKQISYDLEQANIKYKQQGLTYKIKPVTAERILYNMVDISYYEDKYVDELKEHFYQDALDDFNDNY